MNLIPFVCDPFDKLYKTAFAISYDIAPSDNI